MALNVQYGCGLNAPPDWVNFDASPTLRFQKIPVIGRFFKQLFPDNVQVGDIIKQLPGIKPSSCDAVYCSHILEHLSLEDCRTALKNTYTLLKPGGIFRCVMPDLKISIDQYNAEIKEMPHLAAINFMKNTMLGAETRPKGLKQNIISMYGNYKHLWMWDKYSFHSALKEAGFSNIRECTFNDSSNESFKSVEEKSRFYSALAFECIK